MAARKKVKLPEVEIDTFRALVDLLENEERTRYPTGNQTATIISRQNTLRALLNQLRRIPCP